MEDFDIEMNNARVDIDAGKIIAYEDVIIKLQEILENNEIPTNSQLREMIIFLKKKVEELDSAK